MTEPLEDEDGVIPSSGEDCPVCGDATYDTTPNGRPDIVLRVCLECGWERTIPVAAQPPNATDRPS